MGQSRSEANYQAMSAIIGEELRVQCYSGYIYAERPESFVYRNENYQVERVDREWQEPGERYFRVLTGDRKFFELCYNYQKEEWSLRGIG